MDEIRNNETPVTETAAEEKEKKAAPETMDDLKDELEASFRTINEGDVLTGTVIGISDTEILVDFDYYAPGVIPLENASDDPSFNIKERIEIGQTLKATVVRRDDGAGRILLSLKEAAALLAWDRLRELLERGRSGCRSKTLRNQIIQTVAGLHLDHITGITEIGDFFLQNDFHKAVSYYLRRSVT